MAWATSNRKSELPPDWASRRRAVLERRGGRCEVLKKDGSRCRDKATDVDHIQRGSDHSLSNLRGICAWHHARKSAREGVDARAELNAILYRKPETHPGIIPASQATPTPNRGF